jgi:serine/threonine protein kinase
MCLNGLSRSNPQPNGISHCGTCGTVTQAIDEFTLSPLALKKHTRKGPGERELEVFNILKSAKKNAPSLLYLMDSYVEADGTIVTVTKWYESDLRKESLQTRFSSVDIRNFLRAVLEALCALHERGIAHCDVKPENILIHRGVHQESPEVVLGDFGSCRLQEEGAEVLMGNSGTTRWYRSPEDLLGETSFSTKCDTWSLGCVLAELLTGRPLLQGTDDRHQMLLTFATFGLCPPEVGTSQAHEVVRRMAIQRKITIPTTAPSIAELLPEVTDCLALDLLSHMLVVDPKLRFSAVACLRHPYFSAQEFLLRRTMTNAG